MFHNWKTDWCLNLMIKSYHQEWTSEVETLSQKKKKTMFHNWKNVIKILFYFLIYELMFMYNFKVQNT